MVALVLPTRATGKELYMDANKFMTEYHRMCASYDICADCPLYADKPCAEMPSRYTKEFSAKLIKAVEDWSASHPVTTRADLFMKIFPNAAIAPYGTLVVCPAELDTTFNCEDGLTCTECRKKYWSKEVQQ